MSKSGGTKTKNEISIPDFFKPFYNTALQGAQGIYNLGEFAPVVGMSKATQQGLESNLNLADNFDFNIAPKAQGSYLSLLDSNLAGSGELDRAVGAATNPILQQLQRYAIPQTQDAAITAGQFGSSRQGIAEGLARSDANRQMGDIGSQMARGALQQDQQNKQFATSNLANFMAAMQIPANLRTSVGGIQEGYKQEAADAKAKNLMTYLQLVQAMNPGVNTTSTQTQTQSPFQKLSALGSLGLQAFTALNPATAPVAAAAALAKKGG